MLNLSELEQFVAFADNGTLLRVSEIMNISQPTLTRNMRHVEEAFGVSLFNRGKNKLELNDTGKKAVEYSRQLLEYEKNAISMVKNYEKQMRTINIESCAPAPLWSLIPQMSSDYPGKTISTKLSEIPDIISNVEKGVSQVGVLPYSYVSKEIEDKKYLEENLYVCIPKDHKLATLDEITFKELNGFNCLLRDEIGFWTELCKEKMPASRFLIQRDEFEFQELVKNSTLFCFTTNLAAPYSEMLSQRKSIHITDKEANVTYYLISKKGFYNMI
ncbi:LysR family transcriptional regulator [Eubacterium sp. AF15-50]|uniref:LysR family transcriptional regulator n=1 Tax=Eubacterium sp. AF15-50 TaxID=2293103 RepID=UPI002671CA4A|nr:LysR family transcriptional regulator [Eubacterium sp. AF15-50]